MNALFDAHRTRKPRWRGSTAIVLLDRTRCLRCGGTLEQLRYRQSALFWSHGHGATLETRFMRCQDCEWFFLSDSTEVRPDAKEQAIAKGTAPTPAESV